MLIYNTLSGKKETFMPVEEGKAKLYLCGPTVYDYGHLGHGRSATAFDIIHRYFRYQGYDVTFVTNFTDIDDKMITRAAEEGITVPQLADRFIPAYREDYGALGILPGNHEPRATDYIEQMVEIVAGLEVKGHTYTTSDGVYFDITTFPDYGKLSKQKMEELQAGARKDVNDEKRNHQDFVLWKFSKPGEPLWPSPWGDGRPGWHIECSAMSMNILGETFDVHGGGIDLAFPHHECEIAQSEAFTGKPFVKYWPHNGFIQVNKEKMSKSLGNFFTLRDIFQKYKPQAVRLLFLQTHYRSPIEFNEEILEQATNSLARIHDFMGRLNRYEADGDNDFEQEANNIQATFEKAMDNDFETPLALATCFDMIRDVNALIDAGALSQKGKAAIVALIHKIDSVLAIFEPFEKISIDANIEALIQKRNNARAQKDFAAADAIRDELLQKGIQLEDLPEGTVWKRL